MAAATDSSPFLAAIRLRLMHWALHRQGRDVLPLRLSGRRVYILPTAAGWTFALLLAVMFVAGMNYGNGLALLFTFWLAGFALVAMVQTQRRMARLLVESATAEPAHAGGQVRLVLRTRSPHAPQDLLLRVDGESARGEPLASQVDAGDNVAANGRLELHLPAHRRGRWRSPPLRLSTVAPFGLFESWTWLSPQVNTLVYPAPVGDRPPPEHAGTAPGAVRHQQGQDELAWLRDFREGDSPRQVAWKAYARGQPLLVREYHGEGAQRLLFDFNALRSLEVEARLSQLTRWVLDARARGASWELRLPGAAPLSGAGESHALRCLERLALHGIAEAP